MEPRFTVLLPTHNRAEVVGFAISSVLAQTEPNFELLVVGDGCTDGTAEVVKSFNDERVQWFDLPKAPNFGYANRNIALRQARGELIAFAAHDDLLFPDHLKRMSKLFVSPSIEWAYSRPLWMDNDGRMVPFATDLRQADQLAAFLTHGNTIPASCVVYRRRVHERVGWWPEEVEESGDWVLWKRIVGPAGISGLAYQPEPTTLHLRANWRIGDVWGPRPLRQWLDVAATEAWPPQLRVKVEEGVLPQSAVWEAMTRDGDVWQGEVWQGEVRAGVRDAMDFLALHELAKLEASDTDRVELRRELDSTRLETERLGSALGDVEARRAELESSLKNSDARLEELKILLGHVEAHSDNLEARARENEARARQLDVAAARDSAALALAGLAARSLGLRARRLLLALRGNPLFEADWYSSHYTDVARADARRHWKSHGASELRDPNPYFSTRSYVDRYPDVRDSGMDPIDHYFLFGQLEGRDPACWASD